MSGYFLSYPVPSDVSTWAPVGVPGGFGKVFKGKIKGKSVAIKVMRESIDKQRLLYLEQMHGFDHKNLIKFKGLLEAAPLSISLQVSQKPHLVFQYANGGTLLDWLKYSAEIKLDDFKKQVNKWSADISSGMEYLHSKNFNHGTLAARNILLNKQGDKTEFNARISDYGMEELISSSGDNYYELPSSAIIHARWASADYIRDVENFKFRGKSCDVWSFGVVLWEMWTKGELPYGHIVSNEKVIEQIRAGKSPLSFKTPGRCPPEIIRIMDDTFKFDETRRPTFNTLRKLFENIRKQEADALQLKKPPPHAPPAAGKSKPQPHIRNENNFAKPPGPPNPVKYQNVRPPSPASFNPAAKSHYVGPRQMKPRPRPGPPIQRQMQIPLAMQPPPPYTPQDPARFPVGNYANSTGWLGASGGFNPVPSIPQPMPQMVPQHFPIPQVNETAEAARIRELERKIQSLEMKQLEQTVKNLEEKQQSTSKQSRHRSKSKHRKATDKSE